MDKKVVFSKFNLILLIITVICVVIVALQDFQASFTKIIIELSDETIVNSVNYNINLSNNEYSYVQVGETQNNIEVSLFSYNNCVENFELDVHGEKIECNSIRIISREKTLKEFETNKERMEIENLSGGKKIIFTNEFLTEINQELDNDWKLNIELICGIILLSFIIKLVEIVIRRKLYTKLKWPMLIITTMFLAGCFEEKALVYKTQELSIPRDSVTYMVSEQESFYQTFSIDESIQGIRVCFATYKGQLQGDYEFRVYNMESQELITVSEISGSDISDNQYYNIMFDEKLPRGDSYGFTIVRIGDNSNEDTLALWKAQRSDIYIQGDILDSQGNLSGDIDFDFIKDGINLNVFLGSIIVLFYLMVWICINRCNLSTKLKKVIIYAGVFVIFFMKMFYCREYTDLGLYDEMAHISYIAYFEENPNALVPKFEEATLLIPENIQPVEGNGNVYKISQNNGVFRGRITETVNYLGHPPLFYQIMRFTNSISIDGEFVVVNIDRLRVACMGITCIAILIILYIGFSRLGEDLPSHLLYAVMCTSLPMLYQQGPMINNDILCLLSVAIYMLGIMRACEGKRDLFSYFCIAIAIAIAGFTKVTLLLILAILSLYFIIVVCIKEKGIKILWNWKFGCSIPIYIVVVCYYLSVYFEYGTFHPGLATLIPETLYDYPFLVKSVQERVFIPLTEVSYFFMDDFISQWSGRSIGYINRESPFFFWSTVALNLVLFVPLIALFVNGNLYNTKDKLTNVVFKGVSIAMLTTVAYQYLYSGISSFYGAIGRMGSQSRYYVCMLPFFALSIVYFIKRLKENNKMSKYSIILGENIVSGEQIIKIIMLVWALLLVIA